MSKELIDHLHSIKLVVTDINGTLKPSEEDISKVRNSAIRQGKTLKEIVNEILKENVEVLGQIRQELGILTAAVTGGDFADTQDVKSTYIGIAYGAGLLKMDNTGKYTVEHNTPLDWNATSDIISRIESNSNLKYHLSTPELFLSKENPAAAWKRFYGDDKYNGKYVQKFEFEKFERSEKLRNNIIRLCISFGKGEAAKNARDKFIDGLGEKHKKKLSWISRTTVGMVKKDKEVVLDIFPGSVTKQSTIQRIHTLEALKGNIINPGETLMIGDSEGDRQAIIGSGKGVCMTGAPSKFKKSLPYNTLYAGTVAQFLRKYFGIQKTDFGRSIYRDGLR